MTEQYIIRGKLVSTNDVSSILKPRSPNPRDLDASLAIVLSRDWSGTVQLQKSYSPDGDWVTLKNYTTGGSKIGILIERDAYYRLKCSSLSTGYVSYSVVAANLADTLEGGGPAVAAALAAYSMTPPQYDKNAITFLGDSRVQQLYNTVSATSLRSVSWHFFTQAARILKGRLRDAGNFGYGGYRSDEYLERNPAARGLSISEQAKIAGFADNVTAAFATNAYWLMIYGIINDIGQAGTGAALSTDYWNANIKPVVMAWIATGRKVILVTECGSTGIATFRDKIDAVTRYNAQIRQFCRENAGAVLFDLASIMVDGAQTTTGWAFKSGFSGDGVHLNLNQGAYTAGAALAALMDPLVPGWAGLVNSGSEYRGTTGSSCQFFVNPFFQTTTGGTGGVDSSGTVPAGVTSYSSRLANGNTSVGLTSATISTQSGAYGNDLKLVITATGAGFAQVRFDYGSTNPESVGDTFYANCEIDISATTNFQAAELYLQSARGGVTNYASEGYTLAVNTNLTSTPSNYFLQTPELVIQPGTRDSNLLVNLNFHFSGAGGATILVRRVGIWQKPTS